MPASRVACASFNLGTNTTISITRDNNSYTHTLKYNFNGTIGTIVEKTSQTTYVWTPPASLIYSLMPNDTKIYGTVICTTYNSNGGIVGETNAGFYAYAVRDNCVPTVTGTVVDTNASTIAVTGNSSRLVRYISKPRCTISATPKNSATIQTYQIENPVGLVATTSPYVFDTVYSKEFRFKATDSRGYSTTTIVNAPTFIEYDPCYFDTPPTIARTESTSTTATAVMSGYCFNGSFGSASNTLTIRYRYKAGNGSYGSYANVTPSWKSDGTFTASANIPNLSLAETYTFEFVVNDRLTSFPIQVLLSAGMGDLRIAKDYIQTKNNIQIGARENREWKCVSLRRFLNGHHYDMNYGIGATGGAIELRSLANGGEGEIVARYDLRIDKFLHNTLTGMSVAEIMSSISSSDSFGGYFIMNGGNSTPVLVQWGKITQTPTSANVSSPQEVVFPYQYANIPNVYVTPQTAQGVSVTATADNITANGFISYLKRGNVVTTTVSWIAIGNGSNALPE